MRAKRRRFTAEYKLRIVRAAEAARDPGEVGALLRREGLYSSHLAGWRKQYRAGALRGLAAKKRGLDVRLITDQGRTQEVKQRTALHTLRLAGIPIRINQHDGLMHVKQVVIDDEVNTSGSMNHTTSGNHYNDERMDIITDHAITVKAREKFLAMWDDLQRYRIWNDD